MFLSMKIPFDVQLVPRDLESCESPILMDAQASQVSTSESLPHNGIGFIVGDPLYLSK